MPPVLPVPQVLPVPLPSDRGRGGAGRVGRLPVPGASRLVAPPADTAGAVPRREFLRRDRADVRCRHVAGVQPGADGALVAEPGGYPVETAGLVMAPRGFGNLCTIVLSGRLSQRIDARLMVGVGLLIECWSFWIMTGWTPDVSQHELIMAIILQGAGLGLVFTPLQMLAFATLIRRCAPKARACSACSAISARRSAYRWSPRCWRATARCCTSRSAPT